MHRLCRLTLLCATVAACDLGPVRTPICTDEARFSIALVIVDSMSGEGRAAGSTVVLQDGAYQDSTSRPPAAPVPSDSIYFATNTVERAGTYTVRVRRPGYALWEQQNVQVLQGACHVETIRVRARLQASP